MLVDRYPGSNKMQPSKGKTNEVAWTCITIIIIIIIQDLHSAMESEDTEALGGARLRQVE